MKRGLVLVGGLLACAAVVAVVRTTLTRDEPTDARAPATSAASERSGPAGREGAGASREATPEEERKRARVQARMALADAEDALREGRLDESHAAAREALRLDPELAAALRTLAVIEKQLGRADEACRLMRDYVGRATTPEPARARLLASACDAGAAP